MKRILLLTLLFISYCTYAQDLGAGLMAYYPFNGNANDASGNNNNPIFNNATLTSDADGNPNSAYHFNGIDNYMQIPNSTTLNMGMTISIAVKVRPEHFYTGQCYNNMMVMKGDADYLFGNYSLRYADNVWGCTSYPDSTVEHFYSHTVICDTMNVQTNQWYTVVWTSDGTDSKLYINCKLVASTPDNSTTFTNGFDLFIGHLNDPQFPYWLNADLDEVRIYNRALTQDEVDLYGHCNMPPPPPPPHGGRFVDFTAAVVNDKRIALNWNVEDDADIKNYVVERSVTDQAADFTSIDAIENTHTGNYTFIDNTALPNVQYYYRVVMVDNSAQKKFSDIRNATIVNNNAYILVYPNPTKDIVKVFVKNIYSNVDVRIISPVGQVVASKKIAANDLNPAAIDLSSLPKGTYMVTMQSDNYRSVERIIKL